MTLSFSWATNANYSTGPDVSTPTKVDPASTANGFINGTIAAAQHVNFLFNGLATELVKAVDGVNGGTYTLGSALRFAGADVEIAADLEVVSGGQINVQSGGSIDVLSSGDINVQSGGDLNVLSGGELSIGSGGSLEVLAGGDINVASTGQINLASGGAELSVATGSFISIASGGSIELAGVLNVNSGGVQNVNSGGRIDIESGGSIDVNAGGSITIEDQNDLLINDSGFTARLGMTPAWIESDAGTLTWDRNPGTPGGDLIQTNVGAARIVAFPVCLPPGDDILTISVMLNGNLGAGHASLPGTMPSVSLVSVDAAGTQTTIDTVTDSSANVGAYDANHLVTLTLGAPETIDGGEAYSIVVTGEAGANSVANTLAIRSILITGTARSFRGSGTIMHYP